MSDLTIFILSMVAGVPFAVVIEWFQAQEYLATHPHPKGTK